MSGRAGLIESQGQVTAQGDRVARISGKTVLMPHVLPGRQMQGFNAYVTPPIEISPVADTLAQLNARLREDWLAAVSGSGLKEAFAAYQPSSTGSLLAGHSTAAWGGRAYDDVRAAVQATDLLEAALQAASQVRAEDVYAADPLNAWAQRSFMLRQQEAQSSSTTPQPTAPVIPMDARQPLKDLPSRVNKSLVENTETSPEASSAPQAVMQSEWSEMDLVLLEESMQALGSIHARDEQPETNGGAET